MDTKWWLKVDDLAIFLVAVAFCFHVGASWPVFALMALAPDIGMLGYLAGPKAGAFSYNLFHIYLVPLAVGCIGLMCASPNVQAVGLVWIAHIGFDRLLGYGLKTPVGFKHTHLGTLG